MKKKKSITDEMPLPRELSQGLWPGLVMAGGVFFLLLKDWVMGGIMLALMAYYLYHQRRSPAGRARIYFMKGKFAYQDKKYDDAVIYLGKALELVPKAFIINAYLGDVFFSAKDLKSAQKAYQRYFQQVNDHQVRIWYAGKLMEHGLFAEAYKELKKLPASISRERQVTNLVAVCALKSGHQKEALELLERAGIVENSSDEHELLARYLLAKAYMENKMNEKARKILQKLEQDSPGFEDVPQLLNSL